MPGKAGGQGKERITKYPWGEMRAGRDHSLITVMGQTRVDSGKLV